MTEYVWWSPDMHSAPAKPRWSSLAAPLIVVAHPMRHWLASTPTGSVDTTFGVKGGSTSKPGGHFLDVLVAPDGKIFGLDGKLTVAPFTSVGLIDKTFSGDGYAPTGVANLWCYNA